MPRVNVRWIPILALAAAGCTGNSLDDADSGNVVLEVTQINAPSASGQVTAGACSVSGNPCLQTSDCPAGEFCQINPTTQGCVAPDWTVTLTNVPKTDLGTTSPFNDIVLDSLTLTYTWSNGFPSSAVSTPMFPQNQLGLTIPASGTTTIKFTPVSQQLLLDLEAFVAIGGSASADVAMTFAGATYDGEPVAAQAAATLNLANCLQPVGP
jgi:hypothetical protein